MTSSELSQILTAIIISGIILGIFKWIINIILNGGED